MRKISISTLWDVTAALAVVFASAVTFPSEWMDRLQHCWSHTETCGCVFVIFSCKCFKTGVLFFALQQPIWPNPNSRAWLPLGLVTDSCLIMAPCLTVAAAFWCETVAWPVCFYSSVCGEMGSPRAEPDSQNGCCVYRQLADSVHRGMCVSVCGVKNRALTCHNLWFLKQERKRRSVWVMESGCLCSICNYGSLCGPFFFL